MFDRNGTKFLGFIIKASSLLKAGSFGENQLIKLKLLM
jgi:hypothetical protein